MKILKVFFVIALVAFIASPALCKDAQRTASITEINGQVEVKASKGTWEPAQVGMLLKAGDSVRTKASSWALLNVDGTGETATVEVKQNSELNMATLLKDEEKGTQTTMLDLSLGEVLIKAKKLHSEKSKFEVKTPTSIVGVRGTTFSVAVEALEQSE